MRRTPLVARFSRQRHALAACSAAALLVTLAAGCAEPAATETPTAGIREPAVAGSFYPADATALRRQVEAYLKQAAAKPPKPLSGEPVGLLAPHAGYVFSGSVAAHAYATLAGRKYDLILLLGPPHRFPVAQASVGLYDAYGTPLGNVPVAIALARRLLDEHAGIFQFIGRAHVNEHCLEVQLPFLQVLDVGGRILPVLVGTGDTQRHSEIAAALHEVVGNTATLIVISSDLCHYPAYETALAADARVLEAVVSLDPAKAVTTIAEVERTYWRQDLQTAACGRDALLTGLHLVRRMGANRAVLLKTANSGDVPGYGDKRRVVGYGAVAFLKEAKTLKKPDEGLPLEAKKELLTVARKAVEAAVRGQPPPEVKCQTPALQVKRGVFVTLKTKGRLRGCLGNFQSSKPLWLEVRDTARSSATEDYRFIGDQIRADELGDLEVDISVLSPLERIEDPLDFELGKHGIYVMRGGRRGVFLPQVASEMGWSKEQFLDNLCEHKALLPAQAWRDKDTEVYRFAADVFSEQDAR